MAVPEFWLIAGPNGAGKTTFANSGAIPEHVVRLNPDVVTLELLKQRGFASFAAAPKAELQRANVEAAERTFAEVLQRVRASEAVCVETVLSTDKYRPIVKAVSDAGGLFAFVYVSLATPELSHQRVKLRTKLGGHDVPREKLDARWKRSLEQLPWFVERATYFWIFDNSDSTDLPPKLIASGADGVLKTKESDRRFSTVLDALAFARLKHLE